MSSDGIFGKPDKFKKQPKAYWRARKQEKEVAKRFSGNLISGSGAGFVKGDVRIHGVARIECKTTSAKSFSVTKEMLAKIEDASLACDEVPILVIEFLDIKGIKESDVAVIPMWALDKLLNRDLQ